MAAGPSTSRVATSKTRSRRPPAFACDQGSSSSSSFLCSSPCSFSSSRTTSCCESLPATLFYPLLTPTYTHRRHLLLRYNHYENPHIMLLFRLRPQLFSWLMKCAITTIVHESSSSSFSCLSSSSLSSSRTTSRCKSLLRFSCTLTDTHIHSSKTPSSALSPPRKSSHHAIISPASTTLLVADEMRNHHYRPRECDLLSETLDRALNADDEEDGCSYDVYATRRTRRWRRTRE
jgi:hypothetical protein